jgi:hypothetical protein
MATVAGMAAVAGTGTTDPFRAGRPRLGGGDQLLVPLLDPDIGASVGAGE